MQRVLKTQSQKALFDETLVVSHFPNVHVFYISGSSTCWCCIWAYMETFRLYKEAISRGQLVRTTSFHLFKGGNHFVSTVNSPYHESILIPHCSCSMTFQSFFCGVSLKVAAVNSRPKNLISPSCINYTYSSFSPRGFSGRH